MDKKMFRSCMLLITFGIMLIIAVVKIDVIGRYLSNILSLFKPFFIGFAIAFVLNIPYGFFLKKLQGWLKYSKLKGLAKPIALTGAYLFSFLIIGGIIAFIIPELARSVSRLIDNIGTYISNLEALIYHISTYFDWQAININELFISLENELKNFINSAAKLAGNLFPQIFNFTTGVLSSLMNIILGLILSIYMLSSREKLKTQATNLLYAFAPQSVADKTMEISRLTAHCFNQFISGQLTEAVILGSLCFIGMTIFRFDYAFLISVIIAATSVIPVVGAFIGAIPAVFLLLMIDPMQAFWFIIFIVVLQQLEGNIIYPRVVGESLGLPALWVMMAILVGGGMGGALGMLLGVPTVTVIYKLLGQETSSRLKRKQGNQSI